jgi:hypothetical protein
MLRGLTFNLRLYIRISCRGSKSPVFARFQKINAIFQKTTTLLVIYSRTQAVTKISCMANSNYEQQYKRKVIDFFNSRTSYDNDYTIRRTVPLLELVPLKKDKKYWI